MADILDKVLSHPATAYIIGFGGLGLLISLALNTLHRHFVLSNRGWGWVTIGAGGVGGLLIQATNLVTLPGNGGWAGHAVAIFVGAATASAAAGFSNVDLRDAFKRKPEGPSV